MRNVLSPLKAASLALAAVLVITAVLPLLNLGASVVA
jgi:hypothetical protein